MFTWIWRNRGILLADCGSKNWIYPGMEIADMLDLKQSRFSDGSRPPTITLSSSAIFGTNSLKLQGKSGTAY